MENFNIGDNVLLNGKAGFVSSVFNKTIELTMLHDRTAIIDTATVSDNYNVKLEKVNKGELNYIQIEDYKRNLGINKKIVTKINGKECLLSKEKRSQMFSKIKGIDIYNKNDIDFLLYHIDSIGSSFFSYKELEIGEKIKIIDTEYKIDSIQYLDSKVTIYCIESKDDEYGEEEASISENIEERVFALVIIQGPYIIYSTEIPDEDMLNKHEGDHILLSGMEYIIEDISTSCGTKNFRVSISATKRLKFRDEESDEIFIDEPLTEKDQKSLKNINLGTTYIYKDIPYIIKDIHHTTDKLDIVPRDGSEEEKKKNTKILSANSDIYTVSINYEKLQQMLSEETQAVFIDDKKRYEVLATINYFKKLDTIMPNDLLIINNCFYSHARMLNVKGRSLDRIFIVDLLKKDIDKEDKKINEKITNIWNDFCELKQTHPGDLKEFGNAIRSLQHIIGMRTLRREHPESYPTYDRDVSYNDSNSRIIWRKAKVRFIK